MKGYSFDLEDIRNEIKNICDNEYNLSNSCDSYIVEGQSSSIVRQNILNKLSNPDMAKNKYLDMVAYILDTENGTIISLT